VERSVDHDIYDKNIVEAISDPFLELERGH